MNIQLGAQGRVTTRLEGKWLNEGDISTGHEAQLGVRPDQDRRLEQMQGAEGLGCS